MGLHLGNALTEMVQKYAAFPVPQPNGSTLVEPTIDLKHVANSIVHISSLPLNVTVLQMNIMYVNFNVACFPDSDTNSGPLRCHTSEEDNSLR
jgi:hypothetical protein